MCRHEGMRTQTPCKCPRNLCFFDPRVIFCMACGCRHVSGGLSRWRTCHRGPHRAEGKGWASAAREQDERKRTGTAQEGCKR
eukprot:1160899-Pelagomonas_calceolata.AAC.7